MTIAATEPRYPPTTGVPFSALSALLWLSLRQQLRARRMIVLSILFALPSGIALLANFGANVDDRHFEALKFSLLYVLIPHTLLPLTALLYASGMIQDELEEQTLTYLLVRPIPKWALYWVKLLSTIAVTGLIAAFFTALTFVALETRGNGPGFDVVAPRAGKTIALMTLSLAAYCSVFACISLLAKRSLVVGVAYILIFEGIIANIDFVVRRLTVMYYFRVLLLRWLPINYAKWEIRLDEAPSSANCVLVLAGVALATGLAAAVTFSNREFRVKTPEGS